MRARQYDAAQKLSLTPAMKLSLELMKIVLAVSPPLHIKLDDKDPPVLLYTDASDVPDPRMVVGGVLILPPPAAQMKFFSWVVPQPVVDAWISKSSCLGQLELLAAPVALSTWEDDLRRRQVIHFVDNDSANLVRGYSPKQDSCQLVGEYWTSAARSSIDLHLDRVEPKSNTADGPSRLQFSLMHHMGASPPVVKKDICTYG